MSVDLVIATPAFLDLTVVGLEALPALGEERFAGDLLRSPGGGAITAVAAVRLGLRTALVAPLGDDLAGEFVRGELDAGGRHRRRPAHRAHPADAGDAVRRRPRDGHRRPGRARTRGRHRGAEPRAVAANIEQLDLLPDGARRYITCGDDDARAFARRLPPAIGTHAGALPRPLGRARADRREHARGRRRDARPARRDRRGDGRRARHADDARRRAGRGARLRDRAPPSTRPATAT